MLEILEGHCQPKAVIQILKVRLIKRAEAVEDLYIFRLIIFCDKCGRLLHACLT